MVPGAVKKQQSVRSDINALMPLGQPWSPLIISMIVRELEVPISENLGFTSPIEEGLHEESKFTMN